MPVGGSGGGSGAGGAHAVISDVHANMEALEAVLSDINKRGIKSILFLGDAVGYGPDPNEAVAALKERSEVLLAGNHDWAAVGLADIEPFNLAAKEAIIWTARTLTEESKKAIKEYKLTKRLPKDDIFLVHSTPRKPEEWHYLLTYEDAEDAFRHFSERICFVGHSHMPFMLERHPKGGMSTHKGSLEFSEGCRYIINAGSVGQPRDRDPRACYAVIDGGRAEFVRVEYPVKDTQQKMRRRGLPEPLIERLSYGL